MTAERVERRLAAVLAADVAGYSRLMGIDEVGTLAAIKAVRRELVDPAIAAHHGRIVKTTGDGMLVEFASAVDAATCAMAVQGKMAERSSDAAQKITFRIGINVGDIIIDGDDIFGDGVNIAARLEGIAEPGGICISDAAYQQVQGKISADFIDIGDQRLKNIARPIRAYRVALSEGQGLATGLTSTVPRLSMVVLPFTNIGGSQDQDHFVDGVTESLTTDLSRIPDSFVIARNTAFTYKNKAVDIKRIGRELGVNYVIEGSVQRAGNRLRVNVQLIDATAGSHLWAERFDREEADLFEMQDDIVHRLARTLDIELIAIVARNTAGSLPENTALMDHVFRGRAALNRGLIADAQHEALQHFDRALAIDPNNAEVLAGLATAHANIVGNFMTDDRSSHLAAGEAAAMKALKLAPNNARAHLALGNIYRSSNRPMQAISELEQAMIIDRNLVFASPLIGIAKIGVGRSEEVEHHIVEAIRLSPKDYIMHAWCVVGGAAKLFLGRDEEATAWLQRSIEANRSYPLPHFYQAIAFAHQGRLADARREIEAGLALDPTFTMRRFRQSAYSDNPVYLAQRERLYEGLIKAGLPDKW
ncbi:MAG TPA: tetratricopeptide repeat protein [Pseudolabrys sp.]|nr:tetratricopeptide repeat protein [Pseudolabrys sp.]